MKCDSSRLFPVSLARIGFVLGCVACCISASAAPNAPTNLQATVVSPVQINLVWSDGSSDETGFRVERSADGISYTQIAQVLANSTAYRDKGVWPGTSYSYRVRAYNASGNSGYSDSASASTPNLCSANVFGWGYAAPPAGLTGMVAVAAGGTHGLALKQDGTVIGWGGTGYGEETPPAGLTSVVAIAAYPYLSLALKNDGTVVGWGYDGPSGVIHPSGLGSVVAISAGGAYGLALRNDGTVAGWGYNNWGQASPPGGLSGVVAISAGTDHSLALKSDGTIVAWGHNPYGGTTIPTGLNDAVAIAAGEFHSVALRSDGTVVAWGYNNYGQTNVPAGLANVVAIAAGSYFSAALKSDGSAVAWGISGPASPPEGLTGAWFLSGSFRQCLEISCAPFAPSSLVASASASNQVDLAWSDNSTDETGFLIERAPDVSGTAGTWAESATVAANVTGFSDTTVLPSTKYWYRLRASNAGGTSPYGNQFTVATPPLAGPTSLKATVVSATQINLTWTDNSVTEDGFRIERAPDFGGAPGTWAEIATVGVNTTTFSNTGLTELTPYWFRVKAYNSGAESPPSNQALALTKLGAPTNLVATPVATNLIELTWTDTSALESGFYIERANSPFDQSWALIATNPRDVTAYAHTNTSCTQTNYYRVRAFNGANLSAYSAMVSSTTALLDTDGDGLSDCWCLKYFGHPSGLAADNSRATDNADGDPASNLQEYLAGTNPTNSASYLRFTSLQIQSSGVRLTWMTVGGKKYVVQTNSAPDNAFADFGPVITMPGSAESVTNYLDSDGTTSNPARFYRIRVVP
jgi:hypothetical protein